MTAIDVSNYTTQFTQQALTAAELALVQALDPPPLYPPGQTRAQLAACTAAHVPTDIYFFLFPRMSDATIQHHLSLADGFKVRKKWLDLEEPGLSVRYISHVLALMDAYPSDYPTTGIYTGKWWWDANMGNSVSPWLDRDLWVAQYDGVPDAEQVTLFGGYTSCRIKQYRGTSTWNGTSGVDLNVLSSEELAQLPPKGDLTRMIIVGKGMADLMAQGGDQPLCDHVFYTQTDEDGKTFQVEKCFGSRGLYISSNASGQWVNAGPF